MPMIDLNSHKLTLQHHEPSMRETKDVADGVFHGMVPECVDSRPVDEISMKLSDEIHRSHPDGR